MDLFDNKNIAPMELKQKEKPFDSDDYIFELKLDGIRCLAYLDKNETVLINRRGKILTKTYPELKFLNRQVKNKCILDGEIVCVDSEGKPSFNMLQSRALLTNPIKVAIRSKRVPATFVAYDILYFKNCDITNLDLMERKDILLQNVVQNDFLNLSVFIKKFGKAFYKKVKSENLEGIVAKLKTSTYKIGKRSDCWLKIKNLIDEDFVVCGFDLDKKNRIHDLVLGQYKNDMLCFSDFVYLEKKKMEEDYIKKFYKTHKLEKPLFEKFKNKNIFWLEPQIVCTVTYMLRTKNDEMRQPFFKAIRDDKKAKDVTWRKYKDN